MGLDYAFVLVCPAGNLDRAMAVLAAHVVSGDSERLLAARPWFPAVTHQRAGESEPYQSHGLRDLAPLSYEHGGRNACFCFRFERASDPVLQEYDKERDEQTFEREVDPLVRVGCIW